MIPKNHNCGPLGNGLTGWDAVEGVVSNNVVLVQGRKVMTSYSVLFGVLLLFVAYKSFMANK